ncbi:MAG: FISUMP domain-containing protein [Limnohabitans sp.]|nr:FISUMP domain-containing protein [Limnohabitans sp.]
MIKKLHLLILISTTLTQAQVGIATTTPHPSSDLTLGSSDKALLLNRVPNTASIANPVNGMLVFDISSNCFKGYANGAWTGCIMSVSTGSLSALLCASTTQTGVFSSGITASGSFTIPYTGANGGSHTGQIVNSTGVTGLTATLPGGTFVIGSGNLVYNITGTPSGAGTANFAINIGGRTCTVSLPITAAPSITGLTCNSATFNPVTFTSGVAFTGTINVPYTGGNGAAYSSTSVTSTGITGLTLTLPAGALASGAGTVTYNVSGTPSGNGTAVFNITLAGQSCTLYFSNCGAFVASGQWKQFMCHNLGANTSLDPFTYNTGINGGLYQWGRPTDGHQLTTSTTTAALAATNIPGNANFITTAVSPFDWRSGGGNTTRWGNGTTTMEQPKQANDPCPAGFKVPSQAHLGGLFNGTLVAGAPGTATNNTWTWTGNGYTIGSKLYLPASGSRSIAGTLSGIGTVGNYWSSTVTGTNSYSLTINNTTVTPAASSNRATGQSVRCVKE